MFHPFDNAGSNRSTPRPEWMALLARAPIDLLERALVEQRAQAPQWLRRPETGLYMVQGRAGGTGERFNLGEITVTRCALRATADDGAPVGVAYVKGRNHRQAQLAALADALLQDAAQHEALEQALLGPIRQHLAEMRALRATRARATTVDFFTVAREAGTDQDDEESAE
jgi:alpha-D-ribose 1-methylphosphonate 5-triphosphate synthase subunit PhnG